MRREEFLGKEVAWGGAREKGGDRVS